MSRRARLIRAAARRCVRVARRDRAQGLAMSLAWVAAFDTLGDVHEMASVRLVRRWWRR